MSDFLKMLLEIGHKRMYNNGETLFLEGEMPQSLLVLLSGKVVISKLGKDDKDEVLHYLSAPSFIAEMPTFRAQAYPASCVAVGKIEILEISIKKFESCLKNSEFSKELIASLCHKINILEQYIVSINRQIDSRVAQYLLNNESNLANLTQRNIASDINTTAQSLSRALRALKSKGAIATNKGKIKILNKSILLNILRS